MVRRLAFVTITSLILSVPGLAQEASRVEQAPAHISVVEGVARLERDGRTEDAPANMPLLTGDRVRTRAGRVEILFADGSTLHLDHSTSIDLQSDDLVRLLDGRIRLSIPARARDVAYRIDTPSAWAQISEPGDYRAAVIQNAGQTEVEFAVLRGRADLMNERGTTPLRAGERAFARTDVAPSHAYVFNSASWDPFDRWSEARRNDRLALSAQYLPDEVRPYAATLHHHGDWRYESSYGYVWYPRVGYGWRPYHYGRWSTLRPYGWTWIGSDPWAWPTHHYGRWGFSSGIWFWIPGRAWGPAWVSWAYAPGYVSWCPLGWNNRPVLQIVNVYRGYDPWRAWTVIPRRHFGLAPVNSVVVAGHSIDAVTRSAFTSRESAPAITGYAVPRGSVQTSPIRVAGTAVARRSGASPLSDRASAPPESSGPILPRSTTRDDTTRRPSSSLGGDRPAAASVRERTWPDRPVIRSERDRAGSRNVSGAHVDGGIRPAAPAWQTETPRVEPRFRGYEPVQRPRGEPSDRRTVPREEYGRPRGESAPRIDRPAYGNPGIERPPAPERSGPSAQPRPGDAGQRATPPSAAPQSGSRTRPGGGDTPSRDRAVRRPGGGD